jgi:hypothetical protein
MLISPLARHTSMLDIFSQTKKVHMVTQMCPSRHLQFRLILFNLCIFLKVLLWRLCFSQNVIFPARAFICFRSRALHPQFASSYFLSWMPCYCCKQSITVFGLQTYSKI